MQANRWQICLVFLCVGQACKTRYVSMEMNSQTAVIRVILRDRWALLSLTLLSGQSLQDLDFIFQVLPFVTMLKPLCNFPLSCVFKTLILVSKHRGGKYEKMTSWTSPLNRYVSIIFLYYKDTGDKRMRMQRE